MRSKYETVHNTCFSLLCLNLIENAPVRNDTDLSDTDKSRFLVDEFNKLVPKIINESMNE